MAQSLETEANNYPRLSLPIQSMQSEYDVVVVGSGYGAGVAASRMARAGKSVAVLEVGWERRPGSFPHTLYQCLRELSVSGLSKKNAVLSRLPLLKDPTQLFRLVLGDGQHAFVAHGLGGGSLINAGVFLEADQATLQMSPWPSEIRSDPSGLKSYYNRAAAMLEPSTYPEDHPRIKKLDHLQEQSILLGKEQNFYRVPVTTFFHSGRNHVGIQMRANGGSGHECTGLNDGSKNSVTTTYLVDAWNWGTETFCGCEVQYVEEATDGRGYVIYFTWHGAGRAVFQDDFKTQLFWVRAKEWCFLGAGALGTTEILLRSRNHGLRLSPMIGKNMSGNGDLLIFGYNGSSDVNGLSGNISQRRGRTGPTITGVIDGRQNEPSQNPLTGYVIQDGCIPEPFAPVIHVMLMMQTVKEEVLSFLWHPRRQLWRTVAALKSVIMGPYTPGGAIQRTSTYLIMSHDSNEITLTLKDNRLRFRAPASGFSRAFLNVKQALNQVVSRTQARMGFSYFYGRDQEEVTVHVLGGANMSRNGTGCGGVTNDLGQVYTGHGSEVYPGLVCCDGSVIPTALGVNPLATITALAERSLALLVDKYRMSIDLSTENGNLGANSIPRGLKNSQGSHPDLTSKEVPFVSIGWQFTELLKGYISTQSKAADFAISEARGEGSSSGIRMFLTIEICRSSCRKRKAFHEEIWSGLTRVGSEKPRYEGRCTGTVSCRALSDNPMKVVDGKVEFFVPAGDRVDSTALVYSMRLISLEGKEFSLNGFKTMDSNASFSIGGMWKATTTINVRVSSKDGTPVAAGVLRIHWDSFQRQLRTFRLTERFDLGVVVALLTFLCHFILQVAIVFFRPVVPSWFFLRSRASSINPPTRPSTVMKVKALDGVNAILEVHDPSPKLDEGNVPQCIQPPPILFIPGITGIRPAHNIFTLPFQRCNMVDYFTARGSRCYVLTPRWSCDATVSEECTVFDSRRDVAAAMQLIIKREKRKPYAVAHCQGSVALAMGLLDGTIDPSQLVGVTSNSVFINQVHGYWNSVKASSPLLIRLYEYLGGRYFPIGRLDDKSPFQRLLDILLRLYPIPNTRDLCTSVTCRRTSFAFGLLWNHDNLDHHIHDNIDHFFTGTHTKLLEHVVRMGSRGQALDNELNPLLSPDSLLRLKGLPVLWISGTENEVFNPESTLRDYELLRGQFGEKLYQRFLAEGYGHLDPIVGKAAAEDVYWKVLDHLRWCVDYQNSAEGLKPF